MTVRLSRRFADILVVVLGLMLGMGGALVLIWLLRDWTIGR